MPEHTYTITDCAAGNRRDVRVVIGDRDVLVCRQPFRSRWPEPIARLYPNTAVDLALEILRRFAPHRLIGE